MGQLIYSGLCRQVVLIWKHTGMTHGPTDSGLCRQVVRLFTVYLLRGVQSIYRVGANLRGTYIL